MEHEAPGVAVAILQLLARSIWPFMARIQPIWEQTIVTGSRSIIASSGTSSTSPASANWVRRAPPSTLAPNCLAHLAQLVGDAVPLQAFVGQQVLEVGAFLHQRVAFAQKLQLFQPPQAAQAHVEDRLGLHLGQFAHRRRGVT
jgi:hypothetical protein